MSTLRERLMDPHGYNKPLFPKAIAEMSDVDKFKELTECRQALRINVWQSTSQMEEVKQRMEDLQDSITAVHREQSKDEQG